MELAAYQADWQTFQNSLDAELSRREGLVQAELDRQARETREWRQKEAERAARLAPLNASLDLFGNAVSAANSLAIVSVPGLEARDVALCFAWANRRHPGALADLGVDSLVASIGEYEAARLLSARAAELAAAAYYRTLGCSVIDISITQLANNDNQWKDFDLLVDGQPIDVKNARRSFSSPDSYVAHCVPRFKLARNSGAEVTVLGVLSRYAEAQEVFYDPGKLQILGEVKVGDIRLLYRWAIGRFGNLINLDALWKPEYQPGWAFEYREAHYSNRTEAIDQLCKTIAHEQYAIADVPRWVLPLVGLESFPAASTLEPGEQRVLADFCTLRAEVGYCRSSLFVGAMGLLLESMARSTSVEPVAGALQGLLFQSSTTASPLGLIDTQNYVVGLINMIRSIQQESVRRQLKFVAFRMTHPSILRGQVENGTWLTLVAYCGGWRSTPVKTMCGAAPLALGVNEPCPECGHLICKDCGYCSNNCSLVQARQAKPMDQQPRHRKRAALMRQWFYPSSHDTPDFDDDSPF